MPHNFDSVELTNFKRGLLGLQKLFFSSALICWAWLILTVSICAIITVIVRATTTFITVDRVIILFIKLYIENIKYLNISCPNYYDHIYLWLFWLFIRIFSLFSCPLIVNNPHITSYLCLKNLILKNIGSRWLTRQHFQPLYLQKLKIMWIRLGNKFWIQLTQYSRRV